MKVIMDWTYDNYNKTMFNYTIIDNCIKDLREIYPSFKNINWTYRAIISYSKDRKTRKPQYFSITIECPTEYMDLFRSLLDITENVNAKTNYSD